MDILTGMKVKIIRWLRTDEYILQHVQSRQLINMDEYTKLKHISDPKQQITELLDLMLLKGECVCINFLDLLKEDDVNESSPELKKWITSVNTSEIYAAPQSSIQSLGSSVNINAGKDSMICSPVICNTQAAGLSININVGPQNRTDEKPLSSYDRTRNNNPKMTDNQEFLRKNRGKLTDNVKNVDRIVYDLNFTGEMVANVRAEKTDQAKMRKVLEYTNSKKAAELLVDALYEHAEDVMEELTTA